MTELIAALELSPMPTEPEEAEAYGFEKQVAYRDEAGKVHDLRIDLYKRGCFVLESKQGIEVGEQTPLEQIVARQQRTGANRRVSGADLFLDWRLRLQ